LANERGLAYPWKEQVLLERVLDDLLLAVRRGSRRVSPAQRVRLIDDVIRARIFRMLNLRTLSVVASGRPLGAFASVTKLFWAQYAQELHQTKHEIDGLAGVAGDRSTWNSMLWYRQASIAGGTSEIQRNIVAEQALGLPREPRG
jgi:alkylation response protein AidB-like acyl-CoA dehydrogenase